MGASNRDRMDVSRPTPVWVDESTKFAGPVSPGILLEWRQVDGHPEPRWEGLVTFAVGGGELPWSVETKWVREACLLPMAPLLPPIAR
ncbi:hypothetical protein [Nocardioides deserti]|uniref:Uncharacterized protein n=1 Tax=Nocardioides deserti TaxID=1588644 RepID=A0ABR6U399_9ACTN|nr:hypothetical protein [Nocardioides deserti]MBC2958876.1 hypothetical protein [Nocardioides deserti]GGO69389.1 hypothetical protein GCM10012276_05470 [Nocardioides deserti]